MASKPAKKQKPIDLSEYAEEAIPFDAVIRRLAKHSPSHPLAKRKPAKTAQKSK